MTRNLPSWARNVCTRPEIMCLDAAFGATHGGGGLRHVHSFEGAQQKSLPLAVRQRLHGGLQRLHGLVHLQPMARAAARGSAACSIGSGISSSSSSRRKGSQAITRFADHAPALHVADAVLQDAIEQRLPLVRRARRRRRGRAGAWRPGRRRARRPRGAGRSGRS